LELEGGGDDDIRHGADAGVVFEELEVKVESPVESTPSPLSDHWYGEGGGDGNAEGEVYKLESGMVLTGPVSEGVLEFELVRPLGRGAFSSVWLARDRSGDAFASGVGFGAAGKEEGEAGGRLVAVKVAPRDDKVTRLTFEREVSILRVSLAHPYYYYYYLIIHDQSPHIANNPPLHHPPPPFFLLFLLLLPLPNTPNLNPPLHPRLRPPRPRQLRYAARTLNRRLSKEGGERAGWGCGLVTWSGGCS